MKRRRPRYFRIFLALALLIGLLYLGLSRLLTSGDRWVSLKESFVSVSTDHKAIIVLKEVVYTSLNSGYLEKTEEEGKKVKKGQIIASLVTSLDATDEDPDSPDKEESEEKSPPLNKVALKDDANKTFARLNEALKAGNTALALKLKRELQYKLNTLEKSENSSGPNIIEYERYIGSATAKQGDKFSVISSEPGQLSYHIDEYSGKLHPEQLYDFDYDRLFNEEIAVKNMKNSEFKRSDSVFRIISPSKWHIICELDMDEIESFTTQEKLSVIIDGKELKGEVQDQYVINNRALVLIEMRDMPSFVSEERRTQVRIVHEKIAAVVIPYASLVSEGRTQGVYVKGINGERVFRPVDIKHTNEDGYVVTSGSYTIKEEDGSLKTVDTVTSLDQVLVHETQN